MTQIGELLKNIINKTVFETAQEHNRLYNNWNGIVEEAFRKKNIKNMHLIMIYIKSKGN